MRNSNIRKKDTVDITQKPRLIFLSLPRFTSKCSEGQSKVQLKLSCIREEDWILPYFTTQQARRYLLDCPRCQA